MDSTGFAGRPYTAGKKPPRRKIASIREEDYMGSQYSKASSKKKRFSRARSAHNGGGGYQGAVTATTKFYTRRGKRGKPDYKTLPPSMIHYQQNMMKTKAQQIYHDPEALREEIFVLQKEFSKRKGENQKLLELHDMIEEENEQYEMFIQENECFWIEGNNHESSLLTSLRKKERKLEETLKIKEKDLEDSLKSVKYTRIKEMEIEASELEAEAQRLHLIFLELMGNSEGQAEMTELEQRYYKQRNLIQFLKRDNDEMNQKLRILTNQNELYHDELEEYENVINECDQILEEFKEKIKLKDTQIKALRREANEAQIGKNEKKIKNELGEVSLRREKLQTTLRKKDEEVRELNEKFVELQQEFKEQVEKDQHRREDLEKQLNRLNNTKTEESLVETISQKSDDLKEELNEDSPSHHNEDEHHKKIDEGQEVGEDGNDSINSEPSEDQIKKMEGELAQKQMKADEKLRRLEMAEYLSQELSYKVRASDIPKERLSEFLFTEEERMEDKCYIKNLKETFEQEPFNIYNDFSKDVVIQEILFRVGYEEGEENPSYSTETILQAFQDFLKEYTILTENEHKIMTQKIATKFVEPNKEELKDNFLATETINQGTDNPQYIPHDNLNEIFIESGCAIPTPTMDYIILRLFMKNPNLKELPFYQLFEVFKPSEEEGVLGETDEIFGSGQQNFGNFGNQLELDDDEF